MKISVDHVFLEYLDAEVNTFWTFPQIEQLTGDQVSRLKNPEKHFDVSIISTSAFTAVISNII